jgi:flavin-dependent dehydrogenase
MATEGPIRSSEDRPQESYDVAILGGGLAGLSLGIQLRDARPDTSIFLAEKRRGEAPEAAFKVGESTVELSRNYFGTVIGMEDHLEAEHLHKMGLRYFWPANGNTDIAQRVENGPPFFPPVPSAQLDRGRFENELARRNLAAGVDLFDGCRIEDVELGDDTHAVTVSRDGDTHTVSARWVVDATGRAFTLRRKLGLEEANGHDVNSSWFRLAGGLDYEQWVEDDPEWFGRIHIGGQLGVVNEDQVNQGVRHLSTTHLLGKGYWVWLIPLASGPVSIGIVADPRFHPWERINTLDAALDWIREYEPQLAEALDGRRDQVEDFLKVEGFSYGCKRVFSGADRWCLVGEAGAFLDPFYSPGSDFIAMSNTFTTDLVTRELDGEDVTARADAHEDAYMSHYNGFLAVYKNQYELWGNPLAMSAKVAANFVYYWAGVGVLFFHRKLTDLDFMAAIHDDLASITKLNSLIEPVCLEWHRLDDREWRRGYISIGDFPSLAILHVELASGMDDDALKEKMAYNRRLMEAVAVTIFHKAASALGSPAYDENARIDPYAISMDPDRWEQDGLFSDSGMTLAEARQIAEGLENIFADAVAEPVSAAPR